MRFLFGNDQRDEERLHVMSLTGLAYRLADELANELDISDLDQIKSCKDGAQ